MLHNLKYSVQFNELGRKPRRFSQNHNFFLTFHISFFFFFLCGSPLHEYIPRFTYFTIDRYWIISVFSSSIKMI